MKPKFFFQSIIFFFTISFSFLFDDAHGQSFNWHNSDKGEVFFADNNNSHPDEDFVWILDQNSWANGNNTEKMRLGSWGLKVNVPAFFMNGNIGIGTTTPYQKFHVEGSSYFNGNVGIGTYSPHSLLHIHGYTGTLLELEIPGDDGQTSDILFSYNWGESRNRFQLAKISAIKKTGEMGDLAFLTSNAFNLSEGMRLTSDGKVGIGITSPEGKLQIINANQDANGNTLILGPVNQSNLRLGYHQDYSWIQSQGQKPLTINPLGNNVGIGTTSPSEILHISSYDPAISLEDRNLVNSWNFRNHQGRLLFEYKENGITSDRLVMEKGGQIGINTFFPNSDLHIEGNNGIDGLSDSESYFQLGALHAEHLVMDNSKIQAKANDAIAGQLLLNPFGGNIGIGTISPEAKLQVRGYGQNVRTSFLTSDGDFSTLRIAHPSNHAVAIGGNIDHSLQFGGFTNDGSTFQSRVLINTMGNVGIGTTTPTSKLHVNGTMRLEEAFSMAATPVFSIDSANIAGGRFLVNTDGRIGMGVPADKLEENCKLSINGPTYIGDFGAGYNINFIRNSLIDDYFLWVEKGIVSEDFYFASVSEWDDYVFKNDYELPALEKVAAFIKTHKHLPNIPSEAEVKEHGYSAHQLNRGFLKTIEEMTLYAIEQNQRIKTLEAEVNAQKAKLEQYKNLATEVEKLKAMITELKK